MVVDIPTTLKWGLKYSTREKEKNVEGYSWEPDAVQSDFNVNTSPVNWPWPTVFGPMADPVTICALQGTFGPYGTSDYGDDYVSEEDIFALYGMSTMEFDNAIVIAGLRVEDTSFTTVGYNDGDPNDIINGSKDYTFVSPSVNVKYFVDDNTIVRGAVWRALSRPGFGESAPVADIALESDCLLYTSPSPRDDR